MMTQINLIVFNPHAGTRFKPSLDADIDAFRGTLVRRGLVATVRDSRGAWVHDRRTAYQRVCE